MRLAILATLFVVAASHEKRSIGGLPSIAGGLSSIGSFFGPPTTPRPKYPAWKVHKYTGIDLRPVTHEELAAAQPVNQPIHANGFSFVDGPPPKTVDLPEYHEEPFAFAPYAASDRETQAALAAIDNLASLASFLPDSSKGRAGRSVEEAEDRTGGIVRAPIKLKKKALLALLSLKTSKGKKGSFGGGFGGISGGLGGFSGLSGGISGLASGFSGLTSGFSGLSSGLNLQNLYSFATPEEPEGPYPGHTTVYKAPTSSSGLFEGFSLGGREQHGIPVELPEPSLPEIPQLHSVPEAPKLPQLTLPGNYKLPYSSGSYVTIKVPKPPVFSPVPAPVYGVPAPEYGPPALEYGPPPPLVEYGPPPPLVEYGPPPSVEYGPPPPHVEYTPTPAIEYGLPAVEYGTPKEIFHSEFNAPFTQASHNTFLPSAPAPPVLNSYQNQISAYQSPSLDFNAHNVDTSSVLGVYPAPPPIATATYSYYPPAQGYSFDSSLASSEQKTSVVAPETETSVKDDSGSKQVADLETQQLPEQQPKEETSSN